MMFREDSIIARAKQILGLENDTVSNIKKNFNQLIRKYHPDLQGSTYIKQTKALVEAYKVLSGRINPLDCKLLEEDDLVTSLLPKGVKPVKLGIRYEKWIENRGFYDFIKPNDDVDPRKNRKEKIRRGI